MFGFLFKKKKKKKPNILHTPSPAVLHQKSMFYHYKFATLVKEICTTITCFSPFYDDHGAPIFLGSHHFPSFPLFGLAVKAI
jgi:hypothetical protein